MSRIDYSKWDTLNDDSSSSSEEKEEKEGKKVVDLVVEHLCRRRFENLSISASSSSSSPLWNGLVLHHKDVFVSHVLSKLNEIDRCFFSRVNGESWGVLEYAGVDVSDVCVKVHECTSVSTLELVWNHVPWGER